MDKQILDALKEITERLQKIEELQSWANCMQMATLTRQQLDEAEKIQLSDDWKPKA